MANTHSPGQLSIAIASSMPMLKGMKSAKLARVDATALDDSYYLVTGAAGFIGFYIAQILLEEGYNVIGLDNYSNYYSKQLKESRVQLLQAYSNFKFYNCDICDFKALTAIAKKYDIKRIIHMAAQPGVRYSITNPFEYIRSNVNGFLNMLELSRGIQNFDRLVYASSSSVYGNNKKIPFHESDVTDEPISLYAATKKSDELMAYTYSHLYGIKTVGLRFFTVYGPYGRPDMAPLKFTQNILEGNPIEVYNFGKMKRDFTYIDDIVQGVMGALQLNFSGYKIYNLGNNNPVELAYFIKVLEHALNKKAIINYIPIQPGDVEVTYADISAAQEDLNFNPQTTIEMGLPALVQWYKDYIAKIS